jgi:hypothetical protein
MTILVFCSLSFLVFVVGLFLWYYCSRGVTKASTAPVARTMIFCGLLAFLIASGGQLQSCSGSGAGGGGASSGSRR